MELTLLQRYSHAKIVIVVCMHACMYVCIHIHHTLISMGSLVASAYIHDVHGWVDTYEWKHCVNGPGRNLSSLYLTMLEWKCGSKVRMHHNRAGQKNKKKNKKKSGR